ncbi:MAG: HlyD family secretion protein [Vicinamibacterales bacterium]
MQPAYRETSPAETVEPAGDERRPARRRRWPIVLVITVLVTLGLAAGVRVFWPAAPPTTVIAASGRIEGRLTTLTAKSTAHLVRIGVEEGARVARDEVLAEFADESQQARVRAAEARRDSFAAQLRAVEIELDALGAQVPLAIAQAEAALAEAHTRVTRADAVAAQAARDTARYDVLAQAGDVPAQRAEEARLQWAVAQQAAVEAQAAEQRAVRALDLARLDRRRLDAQRAQRDAAARQLEDVGAALAEQQSYVEAFTVRSPLAGTVLARTVEVGERVNAGTPLFTLVDLDDLYVKVYIPEPQIGRIVLGERAIIRVNAYPGRDFEARVARVAQQAEFTPKNVETREERVKLVFAVELSLLDNPGGILKPGMPADAVLSAAALEQGRER